MAGELPGGQFQIVEQLCRLVFVLRSHHSGAKQEFFQLASDLFNRLDLLRCDWWKVPLFGTYGRSLGKVCSASVRDSYKPVICSRKAILKRNHIQHFEPCHLVFIPQLADSRFDDRGKAATFGHVKPCVWILGQQFEEPPSTLGEWRKGQRSRQVCHDLLFCRAFIVP